MVGLQPLELCILVRVQVSEPSKTRPKWAGLSFSDGRGYTQGI